MKIAIAGMFVAMTIAGAGAANASPGYEPLPTWPQEEFPCAEDEVLGFAPYYGPDRVGCIHVDTIRDS